MTAVPVTALYPRVLGNWPPRTEYEDHFKWHGEYNEVWPEFKAWHTVQPVDTSKFIQSTGTQRMWFNSVSRRLDYKPIVS